MVAKCEYLGLAGCNSQLPGALDAGSTLPLSLGSPHIWNWAGTSGSEQDSCQGVQFAVETHKLSWGSSRSGWEVGLSGFGANTSHTVPK